MAARAPDKEKIRDSLLEQLWKKGAKIEVFEDLIFDYMSLYDVKQNLKKDIKNRGVSYKTKSANGYDIEKQNQSVKDLVMVSKQMLLILEKLGLTTDEVVQDNDDEEL